MRSIVCREKNKREEYNRGIKQRINQEKKASEKEG
jgi:hypothetical protein